MKQIINRIAMILVIVIMFGGIMFQEIVVEAKDKYWIMSPCDSNSFQLLSQAYYQGKNKIKIKGEIETCISQEDCFIGKETPKRIKKYNKTFIVSKKCKVYISSYYDEEEISFSKWKKDKKKGDNITKDCSLFNFEVEENKIIGIYLHF